MTDDDLTRAQWRKSSYSGNSGNCVEVADLGDTVAVRDSKKKNGPVLVLQLAEWQAFVRQVRSGNF
jgi:Domain of unknown function (DUF397)